MCSSDLVVAQQVDGAEAQAVDEIAHRGGVIGNFGRRGRRVGFAKARCVRRDGDTVRGKLGEEAVECALAGTSGDNAHTVRESADLLYHLCVLWADGGIRPEDVWAELARREGMSGLAEKASRKTDGSEE